MKQFKCHCTTREGRYIEVSLHELNFMEAVKQLQYELAVNYKVPFADLLALNIEQVV